MKMLSDYDPEELASLANEDFRDVVQKEAKASIAEAMDTYSDVMRTGNDDKARVLAADRIVALAGVEEKHNVLPSGVSEEVFKLAMMGLGQLAGIARESALTSQVLRNVTPAKEDPRAIASAMLEEPSLDDEDSGIDNDSIVEELAHERFEIIEAKR